MRNIIFLFCLFTIQCNSPGKAKAPINCKEYNDLSAACISRFYNDNNKKHLDTALIYIDEGILNCTKYKKLLSLRKLSILSLKKDFDHSLIFIDNIDKTLFSEMPYSLDILKNRFIAMKAQSESNLEKRDSVLNKSVIKLKEFLDLNKTELDSLLQLNKIGDILSNPLSTNLTQYYYYKSIIEGKEKIKQEIFDKQRAINGNKDFFEYLDICLEEDFMLFKGI